MKLYKMKQTIIVLLLLLYLIILLFPLYIAIITSVKNNIELYNRQSNPLIVRNITFDHYKYLIHSTYYMRWLYNTLIICSIVTITTIVNGSLAAYAVTRFRFRGKKAFVFSVFLAYLVPPTLLFIPLYQVLRTIKLIDTLWSLVISYHTFTLPFCTWLLIGYFKTIPKELEESALIDGASRLTVIIRIIGPLALPGLITAGLFAFTLSWSHYLYGVAFVSSTVHKPLAVGVVTEVVRGDVFYFGSLMAGVLLTSLPVVILYWAFNKLFISGLTAGALKY